MSGPVLALDAVTRRYGDVVAVDGVSLAVERGEVLAVVGPSGCGKTTLLQLVAGLTAPDAGSVELAGETVAGGGVRSVPPERRDVGVVFQDHALFPHLTVADNVEFGLADRPRDERRARRAEVLTLVRLDHLADRYPHELSGGEQQRVALARALAPAPSLLLFDEPFASLDPDLRLQLRRETARVLRDAGETALFVTHDREEALSLGDRVAVLHGGRLVQIGTPREVFETPATAFVARFLGEAATVPGDAVAGVATTALGELPIAGPATEGPVEVVLRPHQVVVHRDPAGPAVVEAVEFRGGSCAVEVTTGGGGSLVAIVHPTVAPTVGERVALSVQHHRPLPSFPRADDTGATAARRVTSAQDVLDPATP